MNDSIVVDELALPTDVGRGRWIAGLLVGMLLWAVAVFVAHSFPVIFLDKQLAGPTYAIVALLFPPLAFGAVATGLRVARCPLSAAGFTLENVRADVLIGIFGGATLSVLFLWRGRLTPCVVAHALWNTIASVVIYWRY